MRGPSITPSGRSATPRRDTEIGEAGREPALVEELERSTHALRQCPGAAADEDRREEHVALVDQPRPERLGREARAAHDQIALRRALQTSDGLGIEVPFDPGPRARGLLQGPRVHDLVWVSEGWDAPNHPNDPMMNFNQRDLLRHAEAGGFAEVHVELVVDVEPGTWVEDWDRLLHTAPNPNARTTGEAIGAALTPEEAKRFEAHLRPLVDSGRGLKRSAFAYLWAVI